MAEKALIVLAHTALQSLSRLFAHGAKVDLEAQGATVDLLDLYADNFAPLLTAAERASHYTDAPETAAIASHAALLTSATTLVLVFPTWWFGMPAILKGWIDRVFLPTIAFDNASDFGPIKPRLSKLKRVFVITTLGSPAWIDWLVMRRPVRRILKTAVFSLCAPQAKFHMLSLYRAEKTPLAVVEKFCAKISLALQRQ